MCTHTLLVKSWQNVQLTYQNQWLLFPFLQCLYYVKNVVIMSNSKNVLFLKVWTFETASINPWFGGQKVIFQLLSYKILKFDFCFCDLLSIWNSFCAKAISCLVLMLLWKVSYPCTIYWILYLFIMTSQKHTSFLSLFQGTWFHYRYLSLLHFHFNTLFFFSWRLSIWWLLSPLLFFQNFRCLYSCMWTC